MEVAQKRLELEKEKLLLDKQLLKGEKKHLKQERARITEEVNQCHHKIRLLEEELQEKSSLISELQEQVETFEQSKDLQVEELQDQIQTLQDNHEAVVGELQAKLAHQSEEVQGVGKGAGMSPAKASSTNREIQQYKNKLQSLRLAMEVAVRRTEAEWKEKVDDLEVQLATQEGEYEDALEQQTQELSTQVTQLQEQVDYMEESFEQERAQMQATIERLRNITRVGGQEAENGAAASALAESSSDELLKKAKEQVRTLEKQQVESFQKQQAIVREATALIAQIQTTDPEDAPEKLPLIKDRAAALEERLDALENNGREPSRQPAARSISISRKSSRVGSSDHQKPTLRHVDELNWEGSNQKGLYTGMVNEEGEPHGRGKLKLDNGDVFEGEFKNGKRSGTGCYTWGSTGDLFTGQWKNNRRHGKGVFVWHDGRLYDGEYVKGKREGRGIFTWPYGAKYEGDWKANKRNGIGVYTHSDGRTFSGMYKDDKPDGEGILTDPQGIVIHEGAWVMGKFVGDD